MNRPTAPQALARTPEATRMGDRATTSAWQFWGPYLSERQWGTVREDYSPHGNAWEYLPHDHARSRAYRWGEDGLAGYSDREQRVCLSLALWNGRDPILKERLFGLTNGEGSHGEDVKELYYYLDAAPSHAYLRMLYKYPQAAFPYARLCAENAGRDRAAGEFEIMHSGVFDDGRYFDVEVEYAQAEPGDVLMRITVTNHGDTTAPLHVLPQVWFRNTWSWRADAPRPRLTIDSAQRVVLHHPELPPLHWQVEGDARLLITENESNLARLFGATATAMPCKDAFHEHVIDGRDEVLSRDGSGTKAAAWWRVDVGPRERHVLRVRLHEAGSAPSPFADFDTLVDTRRAETNAWYDQLQHDLPSADARRVQRQAYAGMVWSKQFYHFDVPAWLAGDATQPPPPAQRLHGRNADWEHLNNADVISMPDKWEYPWYAAWDLAFHCIPLSCIDAEFAKDQLLLLTREWYMHPNGQMPAYEWAFGDVNPPVHAWASWRVFQIDRKARGDGGDIAFLERVFHKLMLNFTWWVNRKDVEGRNVFQGGFLGLDNIGVFDRSTELPTGGHIDQADGTSWMAMYALNLMRIALELARHNRVYEDVATKFFEHFLHIAEAMTRIGDEGTGLWDEQDGFFYDVLHLPDGRKVPLKVRSMVGLIPLFAVEVLEPELLEELPEFARRLEWFLNYRPDLAALVSHWDAPGRGRRRLLSLLRGHRMKRLLRRMLDEREFLSPHGVRALSRIHADAPFLFEAGGGVQRVDYQPAESTTTLFGGNSNWRGPVWFPVNYLLIESLQKFHRYYGDEFRVECPTGSGEYTSIAGVAAELGRRLTALFLADQHGRRAIYHDQPLLQDDPGFRDHLLFYEYFHGDTGRGVGASHQTGWTGLVAKLLRPRVDD